MRKLPDLTSAKMQREMNKLAKHLSRRGLDTTQSFALSAWAAGAIIGRNRTVGILNDEQTEAALQMAFEQMRIIAYGGVDNRN